MTLLTISSKGQITLPQDVLQHMGVRPGDKIEVEMVPTARIALSARIGTGKISDFSGRLKRPGQRVLTIDEMNEVISDGWAGIKTERGSTDA